MMGEQIKDNQLQKAKHAWHHSSDQYHCLRPIYTVESAEYLLKKIGIFDDEKNVVMKNSSPVTIVELGCGTGLLTTAMMKALHGKNVRYIATEPLNAMENSFVKNLPDVEFVSCKAETMPFPDSSVSAIIAGASFHWFATQEAYKQMNRVLQPNGMIGYITNLPSETDPDRPEWFKDMYSLLWKSYHKTGAPFEHDYKWRQVLLSSNLFEDYNEDFSLKFFQEIGFEDCIQCFGSFGGVASGGEQHRKEFEANLRNALKKHFLDTKFTGIEHTTEIYTCRSIKNQ